MKIQDFINNRHKYEVDLTYQRPAGAWSSEDNSCLIDTILRGEPIPLFFLNFNSKEDLFYIVDGQQRLHAIRQFYENKIKLNKKFSGPTKHDQTFNGNKPLSDEDRNKFLNYDLKVHLVEDYDDERVRLIFSRLQRGKPLQLGERLNAKAGTVVNCMREIAKHPFMSKSIRVNKERYGTFPDAARILFYETYGSKQMGSSEIYNFFENNKEMDINSKQYKNALSVLNYLEKCFPKEPGNYSYLEKHAWVLAAYTMVRDLRMAYSVQNEEENIRKFIEDFHNKVYNEMFRQSNQAYQRFYDNVRGGWSEKIITLRKTILIQEFLKKNNLNELDEKRQISDEEKISIFAEHPDCEMCGIHFKDFREPEYHHKIRHTDGGKTKLGNIMVLCSKCHDEIHGRKDIEVPSEEDKEDDE